MESMFYNFPEKTELGEYTTRIALPDWFSTKIQLHGFEFLRKLRLKGIRFKLKSHKVKSHYSLHGLKPEWMFDSGKKIPRWFDALQFAKDIVPLNEPDCSKWMVYATAGNAIMSAMASEYTENGSEDKDGVILFGVDDPYVPGLMVEDFKYKSEPADKVTKRGYSIMITPGKTFNVPLPGATTITKPKQLGWAAAPLALTKQWVGAITKFKSLAKNPIGPIRFPSIGTDKAFLNGPLFFVHEPPGWWPINKVTLGIVSDKQQTLTMKIRDVTDYSKVVGTSRILLRHGLNIMEYKIRSFLGVPPFVVELQPENNVNTIFAGYKVTL